MAKKIRFPLEMAEGVEVRTLDELREHFSISQLLMYLENGKLDTWLRDRYEGDLAESLAGLDVHDAGVAAKVCEIFDVEVDLSSVEAMEDIQERNRKIELLKEAGADEKYTDLVDQIAFTQDDLFDLLDDGQTTVYLCGESFSIPLGKEGITYIGINQPTVKIASKSVVDWDAKSIVLTDVRFDSAYQSVLNRVIFIRKEYTIKKREQSYELFGSTKTDAVDCLLAQDKENGFEEVIDNFVVDFYEYDDAVFYVKEDASSIAIRKYKLWKYSKFDGDKAEVSYESEEMAAYDNRDKFHKIILKKLKDNYSGPLFGGRPRFTLLGYDDKCLVYSEFTSGGLSLFGGSNHYFRYSLKNGQETRISYGNDTVLCCVYENRLFIVADSHSSSDKSRLFVDSLGGGSRTTLLTRNYVRGIADKVTIDNGKLCVHYHEPSDQSRTWVSEWYDLNASDEWKTELNATSENTTINDTYPARVRNAASAISDLINSASKWKN